MLIFNDLIINYNKHFLSSNKKAKVNRRAQVLFWEKEFGALYGDDIRSLKIKEALDKLSFKDSTKQVYLMTLSHIFEIGKECGLCEINPVKQMSKSLRPRTLKAHQLKAKFLNRTQIDHVKNLAKDNKYLYCAVMIAISTGMRRGEIQNLKWENILWAGNRIYVENSKNGTDRMCYLTDEVKALLNLLPHASIPQNRPVVTGSSLPHYVFPINLGYLHNKFIPPNIGYNFHGFRHTFASHSAQGGTPIMHISSALGHLNLATTQRYAKLIPNDSAEIASRNAILNMGI